MIDDAEEKGLISPTKVNFLASSFQKPLSPVTPHTG